MQRVESDCCPLWGWEGIEHLNTAAGRLFHITNSLGKQAERRAMLLVAGVEGTQLADMMAVTETTDANGVCPRSLCSGTCASVAVMSAHRTLLWQQITAG